jgi:hypothetical protein
VLRQGKTIDQSTQQRFRRQSDSAALTRAEIARLQTTSHEFAKKRHLTKVLSKHLEGNSAVHSNKQSNSIDAPPIKVSGLHSASVACRASHGPIPFTVDALRLFLCAHAKVNNDHTLPLTEAA